MFSFSINGKSLTGALKSVKAGVETRKSTLTSTGAVEVSPAMLRATTFERSAVVALDYSGSSIPAGVPVEYKRLVDFCKGAGSVQLESVADGIYGKPSLRVTLDTGASTVLPAVEDWPVDGPGFFAGGLEVLAGGLDTAGALRRAASFASKEETRPHLCGILIDTDDSAPMRITAVGTDSCRLGVIGIPCRFNADALEGEGEGKPAGVLVPRELVDKALPAIGKAKDTTVALLLHDAGAYRVLTLGGNSVYVSMREISGRFPNYRQLFPALGSENARAWIDAGALEDAAKRFDRIIGKAPRPMRVSLNGAVSLRDVVDGVETVETVPAKIEHVDGSLNPRNASPSELETGAHECGFNPRFIADCAASLAGVELELRFISPLGPLSVESSDGDRALVMPIRIQS